MVRQSDGAGRAGQVRHPDRAPSGEDVVAILRAIAAQAEER
ncbi:hypothetical protein [Saccharopolyspora hordei]|uniref:Uncharacterized protein n=1 Tax=Saccharopolyspora hordei TaxID=1838 RepID=A0A853ALW4_9PSEU|nr:hypothetical protein [Saccharopolyspora hordei]NYI85724.1 hypothetical protein [Saccharopolyspora hordei]